METSYTIDHNNRISRIGGSWNEFAAANDGEKAMAARVLGHSLWNFVTGFEVQSFLNAVLFAVRQSERQFATIYRCDSPNEARLFRMIATPLLYGEVQVNHVLLQSPMTKISHSVIALGRNVCANRCAMCCSFKVDEKWIDSFSYPETEFFPETHTVCPACKIAARKGLSEVVSFTSEVSANGT